MIIAVTSKGKDLQSELDLRFGRAAQFIVYNTDTKSFEVRDNKQNLNAVQGAGIQAAQNAAETGAQVLITGHCGPKAFKVLQAAEIKVYNCPAMNIDKVIQRYESGELEELKDADVEGHWI